MEHELFLMLLNAVGEKGVLVLLAVMLGAGLIYVAARVYVAMTPSHDDDEALERGTSALGSALSSLAGFVLGRRKPPAPPAPPPGAGLAALALAGLLAVAVGCVPVEAIEHAKEQHAIMLGHALDESLPLQARQIGADGARAMSTQHRVLAGEPLPSELPPELAPPGAPR